MTAPLLTKLSLVKKCALAAVTFVFVALSDSLFSDFCMVGLIESRHPHELRENRRKILEAAIAAAESTAYLGSI